jgi:hypothetical protein
VTRVGAPSYIHGMLRAVEPHESLPPLAYRVPWRIDRSDAVHPRITNTDACAADFVRVFVDTARDARPTESWGQVLPGESVDLCLCRTDPDDVVVTLAWFHPASGVEYVWRFVT